jgi:hypothetical protein
MSPLFHNAGEAGQGQRHGHRPSAAELQEVVNRVAAVPLEQLAAQLMTRYFTTSYLVSPEPASLVDPEGWSICWDLLPDSFSITDSFPDAVVCLQDLIMEAVQLLLTAGLVMERRYGVEEEGMRRQWVSGLVTTRRGRAALASGTVERIINHTYAQLA